MDLIETLNVLGSRIEEIFPHINAGGCCVFAAEAAKHLELAGCSVRILVGDNDTSADINDVRPNLESNTVVNWNDNEIYFGHVIVEFECKGITYHYDSTGVHAPSLRTALYGYNIVDGFLTTKEATELAECSRGWNSFFDRDDIPQIKAMFDQTLSPFEYTLQ